MIITVSFKRSTYYDDPFTHENFASIETLWDLGFTAECQETEKPRICPAENLSWLWAAYMIVKVKEIELSD